MATTAHDAYLEAKISSAEPVELVRMLYRSAIQSVEQARRHLAAGDIRERSAAISKTIEILTELGASLDSEHAPEISGRLAELYDYMGRRLVAANFEQRDQPLAEVQKLLETLAEAWNRIAVPTPKPQPPLQPAAERWNPFAAQPESTVESWSF